MIKQIEKTDEKLIFSTDMNYSLANAIRRTVNEIPVLAIEEVDIYKNDSALYDQIISHRIGLIPLKNQKLKDGQIIELKLRVTGGDVLAKELKGHAEVVYGDIPIVLLEKEQEIELVARARLGKGKEHAKFIPGLVYYRNLHKIEISKDGEKHKELVELYPKLFEFDGKLKVKNAWECDLEQDDLKDFKGITIDPTNELVFYIESWGQLNPKDIFIESIKELNDQLSEVSKALK
ncbi:MAG: DNA-directed RNA polymerase subunit D [Nanoarchaeota archaeon]|nr:DNA-directed RNA polymerase subunit D [Nanoarchaeota archaeon]